MIKLLSLSMTLWKKNKQKFIMVFAIVVILLLTFVYASNESQISTSEFITYYTFMIGFHMQSYVSVNMTKKAEVLKENESFVSITRVYKKTILTNLIGLIVVVVNVIFNLNITHVVNEVLTINVIKGIEIIPLFISLYFLIILIDNLIRFFNYMEPEDK